MLEIVTKACGIIRQNIVQIHVLTVGYDVDFYLPYFQILFTCL